MELFFQVKFFPNNASLCQVDGKTKENSLAQDRCSVAPWLHCGPCHYSRPQGLLRSYTELDLYTERLFTAMPCPALCRCEHGFPKLLSKCSTPRQLCSEYCPFFTAPVTVSLVADAKKRNVMSGWHLEQVFA